MRLQNPGKTSGCLPRNLESWCLGVLAVIQGWLRVMQAPYSQTDLSEAESH